MKLLIPSLLAAALACAQSSAQLEIRGTVVEGALGIGGVTVTLYEFGHTPPEATTRSIFAVTFTDATGKFTFHPVRAGEYYVEVQKESYFAESYNGPSSDPSETTGDPVSIDADHPLRERKFSLWRLGEVRGRVIDEDGQPLAHLRVVVLTPDSYPTHSIEQATTDSDGYFAATKLRPGDYVVNVPRKGPEILPQFSEEDLKALDQDFAAGVWPAVPLPVRSGASLSVGTITLRKATYYRAYFKVSGDCGEGDYWTFSATPTKEAGNLFALPVACGKDFLVRNLAPGSYWFVLSTSGRSGNKKAWAITPVEVTDKNLEVALSMSPGADISGRLVAAEGVALPRKIMISVSPVAAPLTGSQAAAPELGQFRIRGLPSTRHRISVNGLSGKLYIKEIRYNGLAAVDGTFIPIPGAPGLLEIVIDDQAATISGSVAERDKVTGRVMIVAAKWPSSPDTSSLQELLSSSASAPADDRGRFQIDGLSPGEYRVLALTEDLSIRYSGNPIPLVNGAEKVTLERGSLKDISLKLIDPSQ
jgi:hypothetical protein